METDKRLEEEKEKKERKNEYEVRKDWHIWIIKWQTKADETGKWSSIKKRNAVKKKQEDENKLSINVALR